MVVKMVKNLVERLASRSVVWRETMMVDDLDQQKAETMVHKMVATSDK
jgi:hypothetical protein